MDGGQTRSSVEIRGLTRRFGRKVAVHPLDMSLGPGGITGLLGPNGSGKSTLLRMLVGIVRPHGGTATVAGVVLRGDGTAVRRLVAYAPGEIGVYGEMSGREHLRWLSRGRGRAALVRAVELAERLGLPLRQKVRGYSHGMKRQMFFAAALAPRLPVRILDEPTEGLDPSKRREVLEILAEDAACGTTILLSSHHLAEVDRACTRLVFLSEGNLVADELSEDLRRRARRLVRITFDDDHPVEAIESALRRLAIGEVHRRNGSFAVVLAEDDPRPFFDALARSTDLPTPESVSYGEPSLRDLYRDLYGVEGV